MESVFFDVNPSLRQLTENTQRASDQLQRSQQKEMRKTRASKSTPVDSAELSTEAELMGEDLMGSMDPDQFRGRRRGSSFQEEKEKRFYEAKDNNNEKKSEEGVRDLIQTIAHGQKDNDPVASHEESKRANKNEKERIKGEETDEEEKISLPKEKGLTRDETGRNTSLEQNGGPGESDAPQEDKDSDRTGIKDQLRVKDDFEGKTLKKTWVEEKPDISKPKKTPEDNLSISKDKPKARDESKSEFTSLLSWDEGFIIADPQKRVKAEEEGEEASQEYDALELPPDEDSSELVENQIIDDMISGEVDEENLNRIRKMINPFGIKVLKICRNFGTKICLLLSNKDISSMIPEGLYGKSYDGIRTAYVPEEKLCILGEESLKENSESFIVPRLYFAHSFDNALGKDDFASLKSAAVMSNYNASKNREPGHQFIDVFSSLSPVHYFAQAVESYLNEGPENGQFLCTRQDLYDMDRSMYLYIEYLFRQINK